MTNYWLVVSNQQFTQTSPTTTLSRTNSHNFIIPHTHTNKSENNKTRTAGTGE